MSVPHSPAELQKLYQKRFAGMREYRDFIASGIVLAFISWDVFILWADTVDPAVFVNSNQPQIPV